MTYTNLAAAALIVALLPFATAHADDWPEFRGANGQSVSESVSLPLEWSVETGKNIAWSADLPGRGVSSPIVVDGRVIITAASGAERNRLHVLAFDSMTGQQLWQRQFWATGRTLVYETSSVAAPTPATDGQRIFAFYSSNDLVCLDLDGNLQWIRGLTLDHVGLGNDIGMAASPVVADETVIVQCVSQTSSFAAGLNAKTGANMWETPRPKGSNWASPAIVPYTGAQGADNGVLLQGQEGLTLRSTTSGAELWSEPLTGAAIASPSFNGTTAFVAADGLSALKRTPEGMEVLWRKGNVRPATPSPVAYDGRVYVIGRGGVLAALTQESGRSLFKRRLAGAFSATPLAVDGRLYCMNQEGKAFVVEAGGKGKILAESDFGADIYGSPAAADGGMFVRSHKKLWKIALLRQAQVETGAASR